MAFLHTWYPDGKWERQNFNFWRNRQASIRFYSAF